MRMNSYFQMKERAPGLTPNCNNIVTEKNAMLCKFNFLTRESVSRFRNEEEEEGK